MAFEKVSNSVHDLNSNVQSFLHSNSEYYKLKAFKQGMKGATSLVRFLVMGFLLSTAGVMLSFALAIVISEAIGVPSSGYFIIGGFYLIVFVLIFIFGKEPIEKLVLRKFSKAVFDDKND
ncbi:phage holin family protein [Christiangramia echinicola]|uniref:Holin-X, holin superfamily III n=1 Tax=Christiangramia echinicola TaxID=279359 RepID=A0A1H1N0A5_9FLAO|nr:phage holin family protein [Christiangramia echinicola]SDR92125.1 Putative Holin-X, holin superfamily III [Christiangramia echinicola]